ncbi:MAG: hypothetical protein GF417_09820 [Candidatus Latescibacteria bacterium]|nr:hypothetical protein [bacterium]MBD3424723.1 hypothetical protein [Candidatus Latescibacterota bacterium]
MRVGSFFLKQRFPVLLSASLSVVTGLNRPVPCTIRVRAGKWWKRAAARFIIQRNQTARGRKICISEESL